MRSIKITYTAVSAPVAQAVAPICRMFLPNNAAADTAAVAGTYYDTNVDGFGEGMILEAFMNKMVAHPGLIAQIRKAIKDGSYQFEATEEDILYLEECAPALADQGITIEVVNE